LGSREHIQKSGDIGTIGRNRVFDGAGHRSEGGLVQDEVNAVTGFPARLKVAYVAFDKGEALPLGGRNKRLDFIQIVLMTSGEIVQADDGLVELQQGLEKIGPDEPCHPGDEPVPWVRFQIVFNGGKWIHLEVLSGRLFHC
jgi:hypothetical protein